MQSWTVEGSDRRELPDDVREAHVRLINGEVAVTAVADGPARVEVTRVEGHAVAVTLADGVLDIRCDVDATRRLWGRSHHSCRATVALLLPAATLLELGTVSAAVVVAGADGEVSVETVSGAVTLDALTGPVTLASVSGDIEARALSGELRASTVSGDLTVAAGRCPALSARSVSGRVALDFDLDPAGRYDLTSVSGEVALRLPGDVSVDVDATSVSGRIESAFAELGTADRRPGRRRLSGRIGQGGPELRVTTTSGDVTLVRRGEAA